MKVSYDYLFLMFIKSTTIKLQGLFTECVPLLNNKTLLIKSHDFVTSRTLANYTNSKKHYFNSKIFSSIYWPLERHKQSATYQNSQQYICEYFSTYLSLTTNTLCRIYKSKMMDPQDLTVFGSGYRKMSENNCGTRSPVKNNNSTTIAVCQLTAKNNKENNFVICQHLIESAWCAGAKVIFLPEACDYVAESKEETIALSEPLTGPLITKYRNLAKRLNVWLSLGGVHDKINNCKIYNTHVIINNDGEVAASYRKLHLFDVDIPEKNIRLIESNVTKKGDRIVPPCKSPAGDIGMAICYDIRFPELSLALSEMGATILTYPSAFTFATGAMHWEVLLRTRAIETQCYVVAAAQTGIHNKKRTSWGHAMVVDPTGNIIAQCSEGTGFALASINQDVISNTRLSMPLQQHRRTDIYPTMVQKNAKSYGDNLSVCDDDDNDTNLAYQFGQVIIPGNCVFYKTKLTMAFVNKRCVVPGHVLVAPIRPALRMTDLTAEEVADMFLVVQKVEKAMEAQHNCTSTTIAVQDGPDAGRTIKHIHVHILPRKEGDFLQNDEIYYKLQKHDKAPDKPWRAEEDMIKEANQLKKLFN